MSSQMNADNEEVAGDFRRSGRARRQSWFGLKRLVKEFASYSVPHAALRLASRHVPKLRSGRLPAPKRLKEVVGRVDGASFVMVRPDRCENAKELYWGNGSRSRPEDVRALDAVVRLARDADVLIDIGAYTGLFTLATTVANRRLKAHAFEIVPRVADLLEANIRRNAVDDRVTVHREGIGIPDTILVVPSGEGGSALPSFYSAKMHFEDGVEIPFRSLDSVEELIDDASRLVMKVDVEGTETEVFKNGMALVERHLPDVLCEVLHGSDPQMLNELLIPLGYSFYLVTRNATVQHGQILPNRQFRDWLFTVRPNVAAIGLGPAPQ
jgi:FkbM family methyltransferase